MHSNDLGAEPKIEIDLNGLFTEAGVMPEGGIWIVPTDTFLRIWETAAGAALRERGFEMTDDGIALGASQDCVVRIPAGLIAGGF